MDAKAPVDVGEFSRGGKSRVETSGLDHDFKPDAKVTPVGILLPELDELNISGVTSKVTSDCLVDCLESWRDEVKHRFEHIKTLLITYQSRQCPRMPQPAYPVYELDSGGLII
jgi:hypothetical protein